MKLKSLDYAEIIESFTNRYENIIRKMRFQQRQQQERDQRKVEMVSSTKVATAATSSSSIVNHSETGTIRSSAISAYSSTSSTTTAMSHSSVNGTGDLSATLGAGKVRQMFDERRHRVAGIDKSYPLQPIQAKVSVSNNNVNTINNNNNNNIDNSNNNGNVVANGNGTRTGAAGVGLNNKTRVPPISANTKARLAMQQRYQQQEDENGEIPQNATFDDNENLLEDEKFPDTISFDDDLPIGHSPTIVPSATRRLPTARKLSSGPQNVNSLKLKPVPGRTPSTPSVKTSNAVKTTPRKTSAAPSSEIKPKSANPSPTKARSLQTSSANSTMSRPSTVKSTTASATRKPSPASPAASAGSVRDSPVPDGLSKCDMCGRSFADDRIAKHREICKKTKTKKRKVFDATKHRVAGTDAEKYVMKKKGTPGARKSIAAAQSSTDATRKSDWRRKHEEFIQAIRAAKEMQAHLAKGGKLSDLPPPPPSENPDYIQCPHCSRRFNKSAADRHIPKCATMLHNKPKPTQTKTKRF
ncbi:zinc finger C2HC domain-containing protein 1C-like isoform X2 [Toxorhynchites rutilus septentrionalis]|uniref:zinc finger C2HC domain-containing protein 1C-like isoform X2 n=1 Tax=Toxorhynchites rutilus septentrionalis TaxID=329112 RepID=UPI0024798522|nr:zinc finger C2HC domain-containing protein 1C-like isoform X2 [Toxorhynchites rutilus septentrionalis]